MKKIFRYFIQGIIYLAPFGITAVLLYYFVRLVNEYLIVYLDELFKFNIPGLGIAIVIVGITFLGFLGQTIIARPFKRLFEIIMNKSPLIKVIYTSIRDLLSAFVGKEKKFNQPVLVKINLNSNIEKIGFLTQTDLSSLNIKDKVSVYFPHSYNFSGEMYIVPAEQVKPLDIPPSEAMKFIVSGGVSFS